ncbi:MAG: helix-turn-helix transcriptional regulator [Pseudomonadota bacterium]
MATNPRSVLNVNPAQETTLYRNAVAQILLDIQRERDLTLHEIAEAIGVSLGTISNAANKKGDLSVTYLKRLGECFGPEMLNPYAALSGGRMVPLDAKSGADILPFVMRLGAKIAIARCPSSPGGVREIHSEQLDYLSELLALQREVEAKIQEIRELAA